jgi:hypothetical protein
MMTTRLELRESRQATTRLNIPRRTGPKHADPARRKGRSLPGGRLALGLRCWLDGRSLPLADGVFLASGPAAATGVKRCGGPL